MLKTDDKELGLTDLFLQIKKRRVLFFTVIALSLGIAVFLIFANKDRYRIEARCGAWTAEQLYLNGLPRRFEGDNLVRRFLGEINSPTVRREYFDKEVLPTMQTEHERDPELLFQRFNANLMVKNMGDKTVQFVFATDNPSAAEKWLAGLIKTANDRTLAILQKEHDATIANTLEKVKTRNTLFDEKTPPQERAFIEKRWRDEIARIAKSDGVAMDEKMFGTLFKIFKAFHLDLYSNEYEMYVSLLPATLWLKSAVRVDVPPTRTGNWIGVRPWVALVCALLLGVFAGTFAVILAEAASAVTLFGFKDRYLHSNA